MMGFFAFFCGFMYNDFVAFPIEFFDSCYDMKTGNKLSNACIYPAGLDPVWYLSK